jgi:hypothetical protein
MDHPIVDSVIFWKSMHTFCRTLIVEIAQRNGGSSDDTLVVA